MSWKASRNARYEIPDDGTSQGCEDKGIVQDHDVDDPLANRVGHGCTKDKHCQEIEGRGPIYRDTRCEHTRRDNRGNGVRCVVKAVDKIEGQRHKDQTQHDQWRMPELHDAEEVCCSAHASRARGRHLL